MRNMFMSVVAWGGFWPRRGVERRLGDSKFPRAQEAYKQNPTMENLKWMLAAYPEELKVGVTECDFSGQCH
jgi:hypothetical protein